MIQGQVEIDYGQIDITNLELAVISPRHDTTLSARFPVSPLGCDLRVLLEHIAKVLVAIEQDIDLIDFIDIPDRASLKIIMAVGSKREECNPWQLTLSL